MSAENTSSRIFVGRSDGSEYFPSWPEKNFRALPYREAVQVTAQSEVSGIYFDGEQGEGYSFQTRDGERFRIYVDHWEEFQFSPEGRARLAKEVEEKMGQKDLTIILY